MDRPRLRSCDALLCAALLCAGAGVMTRVVAAVPAQGPGPPAGVPTFPVPPAPADDAPAARLDVVATDPQGRAVADLRRADFELLERGVARTLISAEYRGGSDVPRAFAFLLDDFHVASGESTLRARAALSTFVDQLDSRDLVAVLKPLEPAAAVRFTRDREPLRAAIAAFEGRQGDLTPRGDFETQFIGRAPEAVAAARAQIVTAALRDLTLRAGELEVERPILVFVSDGFRRDSLRVRGARGADLQEVVRAAGRLHLTIYPFSPGGAETGPAAEPAMLEWLASQTGGRAVKAPDDLAAGFTRLLRDLASCYTLTWRPPDPDGRFHPIELRTTRRRVELRARAGYWAPLPVGARASVTPSLPMRALHRSAMVDTWVGFVPTPEGQPALVITWEPHAGVARPTTVRLRARTPDGVSLFDGPLGAVRASSGGSTPDSARFAAAASRVELDIEILDAAGRRLDLDTRDVEVPDLRRQRSGPVLWSPQVIRARAFREFESLAADPAAAPSSSRRFARGDRLLIRVPALDASGDAVAVSARLLNAWGQPMREIPSAGTAGEGIAQFGLALSWLGPGQYLIELSGANAHGSATERIPFTLVG